MKKIILFILIAFYSHVASATHGMGGEVTWTCDGTGNYIFHLKFYRDCNGIPGPGSVTLETNHPQFPAGISMQLVTQNDISPTGSNTSGNTPCHICSQGSAGSPIPGLVEEFIFESQPVTIPGIPTAAGWAFWYQDCCRSNALTNVTTSAGNVGYALVAKMYPFAGQAAGFCSDASPYFAEKPSVITCTGYPFTYNHFAIDPEMDSLNYSWTAPLDWGSYPQPSVNYKPGYSVNSPMPSTTQDPNNIPATIDSQSGQIEFTSFTQGYFVMNVKVSSYKCGQLTAEISREINIVLMGGCTIPGSGGNPNNPPIITPPFPDAQGNPQSSYETTVHAGDTLNFDLPVIDLDFHPINGLQMVTCNASGQQYGAGFNNNTTGCLIPPCATLYPPPPNIALAGMHQTFHWVTTTSHLGYSFGCVHFSNKYYFIEKAQDNYCPANGFSNATITITVLPIMATPIVNSTAGQLTCTVTGNFTYQWFLNGIAIPGAIGQNYTPIVVGNYQVLVVNNITGDGNYSAGVTVNTVGINEYNSITGFNLYPNPTHTGLFKINFNSIEKKNILISIKDVFGKYLVQKTANDFSGSYTGEMDLSKFSKGIYLIELKTGKENINKKVILL